MHRFDRLINMLTSEIAIAVSIIMLCLVLFLNISLLPQYVLTPADGIFETPFFADRAPSNFKQPSNPLLFDQVYQFTPWRHLAWQNWRNGEIPLWNPFSYSGTPLAATMQSAVFYPINLLLLFLPFHTTLAWSAFLRLLVAGGFTFLLSRKYGTGLPAAIMTSVSFMLSGFLIVWLGHPHTNVAVWLPALVFFAELLLVTDSKAARLRATAGLAVVISFQILGGHIETTVDCLFALAVYYPVRWIQMNRNKSRPLEATFTRLLLLPGLALSLGVMIAAVQLLPFFEWLARSAVLTERSANNFQWFSQGFIRPVLALPLLVFPNLYNNPTWDYPYWSFLLNWGNFNELILYVGTIPLLLAIVAVFKHPLSFRPLVFLWVMVGLIVLGRALQLPFFDWINQFPILELGQPARLRLIFSFSLCILAGFGLDIIVDPRHQVSSSARKLMGRLTILVIGAGLALMVASNLAIPLFKDRIVNYGRQQVEMEYASRISHSNTIDVYYEQVVQMVDGLQAAFSPFNFQMYAPMLWALLMLALLWLLGRQSQRYQFPIAWGVVAIVLADMILFGNHYNPTIPVGSFYPSTPITDAIAKDSDGRYRVTALRQDLLPDSHLFLGFQDLRGLDFPTATYNHYLDLIPSRIPWLGYGAIFADTVSPLLRVLNVKYVISENRESLDMDPNMHRVEPFGRVFLGAMTDPQPRAFLVHRAEFANTDTEAAAMLSTDPDAVYERVIISADSVDTSLEPHEMGKPSQLSTVALLDYRNTQATWSVDAEEPGYLVVTDSYYPGWNASVDGQPADLLRANLAFRAVMVPAGHHIVSFVYRPFPVWLGLILTTAGLAAIGVLLFASRRTTVHLTKLQ